MTRATLLVFACLLALGSAQPFFFPGFGASPFGASPFGDAAGSAASGLPLFGNPLSSVANFAQASLGSAAAFGLGGLNGLSQSMRFPNRAKVMSSFTSSSSTQNGNEPPKVVSQSFSSVSKTKD